MGEERARHRIWLRGARDCNCRESLLFASACLYVCGRAKESLLARVEPMSGLLPIIIEGDVKGNNSGKIIARSFEDGTLLSSNNFNVRIRTNRVQVSVWHLFLLLKLSDCHNPSPGDRQISGALCAYAPESN